MAKKRGGFGRVFHATFHKTRNVNAGKGKGRGAKGRRVEGWKGGGAEWERGRSGVGATHSPMSTIHTHRIALSFLLQIEKKVLDGGSEGGVGVGQARDAILRIHDGGVVASAEVAADFLEGVAGEFPCEVHADLARQ